jgi:hypothetical protein
MNERVVDVQWLVKVDGWHSEEVKLRAKAEFLS